ncbi:hypothetical protein cyc_04369 [Cyclospora cayetanensis]|uniref:Derlin n=1 Tax=Cyclospora cayetanensis TaxID=88456 RepID=A0A1D3CY31_9EIME|nr:hypothetical protein cyc_04369 [Cyclospora cayetanensis]
MQQVLLQPQLRLCLLLLLALLAQQPPCESHLLLTPTDAPSGNPGITIATRAASKGPATADVAAVTLPAAALSSYAAGTPAGAVAAPPRPLAFFGVGRAPPRSWLLQQQKKGALDRLRDSALWHGCSSLLRSYTEIPVATRSWLTASFLLSVLGTGERPLVPPEALCMHWGRAGRALELWRPLTAALFQGPFSFSTLTRIYASYVALRQLETTERQALLHQPCSDFLAVECLLLAAAGSALGMPFYGSPLTAAATYVISKTNPEKKAPLPLGLQVPQKVLPFALAALDAVQQQSLQGAVPALLGIATGHIFYLLKKVVPAKTGIQMLPFPSLTYRLLLQKQVRDAAGSSSAAAARISSKFLR